MTLKLINQKTLDKNIYSDMKKQFPAEELKTYSEYNTLLASGDYKLGLVFDDNNLIGYILYLTKDFIWVDYIAVLKEFHSKGYGGKILASLFEKYSHLKGCYFEVEPEDEKFPQTIRRMNFYKRLNCSELNFVYYFPNPLKKLKMKLLYKSFDGKIPDREKIKKDIEAVFEALHKKVECRKEILELIYRENS